MSISQSSNDTSSGISSSNAQILLEYQDKYEKEKRKYESLLKKLKEVIILIIYTLIERRQKAGIKESTI